MCIVRFMKLTYPTTCFTHCTPYNAKRSRPLLFGLFHQNYSFTVLQWSIMQLTNESWNFSQTFYCGDVRNEGDVINEDVCFILLFIYSGLPSIKSIKKKNEMTNIRFNLQISSSLSSSPKPTPCAHHSVIFHTIGVHMPRWPRRSILVSLNNEINFRQWDSLKFGTKIA